MKKEIISTTKAPAAIGPYSQGTKIGNLIFTSGQIPINPETGELVNTIEEATRQSLENVKAILDQAGSSIENVVKTVIYLKDLNDFQVVNQIYSEYFNSNEPARSCIEVSNLPKGALIEIEAIAYTLG